MTKSLAVLLTFLFFLGTVCAVADTSPWIEEILEFRTISSVLTENAALEGYIDRAFGLRMDITPRDARLSGLNLQIYNLIKPKIKQVAAGQLSSTVFEIDIGSIADGFRYTLEQLQEVNPKIVSIRTESGDIAAGVMDAYFLLAGFDIRTVADALIANLSYDLYWFNKSYSFGRYIYTDGTISVFKNRHMTVTLHVAPEFSSDHADRSTSFDTSLAASITTAAETAQGIVSQHSEETDFQKLHSYKEAICGLTSYNSAAAGDSGVPYGNPWQLVWVFDGDPETKVVCEGYAKAFKYLCELSSFQASVSVSMVTGTLVGAGKHMWNLVSINGGLCYLVDVTNCDEGQAGYPDYLFMAGYSELYESGGNTGYRFAVRNGSLAYVYNSSTVNLYSADDLAISDRSYSVEDTPLVVASGTCGSQLTWTLDEDGLLIVNGTGPMDDMMEDTDAWCPYSEDIRKVLLHDGITSIGQYAFSQCSALTDVFLPNSLIAVNTSAFEDCTRLRSVRIPANISSIGDFAFSGCESLSSFHLAAGNLSFAVSEDGVLFTRDRKKLVCYPAGKTSSYYQVPFATVEIGVGAFCGCAHLSEILIPDSVTEIGDAAFLYCSGLTDVVLPNHLQSLSLLAFGGCSSLSRVQFPLALTEIGEAAFLRCSSLSEVSFAGTADQWNNVEISRSNSPLETAMFRFVPVTVNFVLPASLSVIESQAFTGIPAGSAVQIPDNVANIAPDAFDRNILLVTSSGSYAARWANEHGFRWVDPPDQP